MLVIFVVSSRIDLVVQVEQVCRLHLKSDHSSSTMEIPAVLFFFVSSQSYSFIPVSAADLFQAPIRVVVACCLKLFSLPLPVEVALIRIARLSIFYCCVLGGYLSSDAFWSYCLLCLVVDVLSWIILDPQYLQKASRTIDFGRPVRFRRFPLMFIVVNRSETKEVNITVRAPTRDDENGVH